MSGGEYPEYPVCSYRSLGQIAGKRRIMGIETFMTSLNYASCNEDWRSEWDALRITSEDRVLCITGSGDRPLNIIAQNPEKVTAMDLNATQNYLLRLKMVAMRVLPYSEYSSFLGLSAGTDRLSSWRRVRRDLPEECRRFWDNHTVLLEKGIIYSGRWERHLAKLASIVKVIRGTTIDQLFAFDDIEEQRSFVEVQWDRWWWRWAFRVFGSATFSRLFFGDPGFYQYAPKGMNIGRYVFDSMKRYLENGLARESFMLSLMFRSKLSRYDLPPYLDPVFVNEIIKRLHRIEIRTGNLLELMENVEEGCFTKFSLSDVPSFLNQKGFERLLDGIVRSGVPGARFCIRQFLTDHRVPNRLEGSLVREPDLEDCLRSKDRSFAYRFIAGSVIKER